MPRKSAVVDKPESKPGATVRLQEREAEEIISAHLKPRLHMVSLLQDLQGAFGYLPEAVLRLVAERTGRSLVDVYGVATFYRMFRFKPRGRQLLSVCLGTACHVRGGAQVASELGKRLGLKPGETTADGEFTLETVNCLGCCAIGPVVVREGRYHGQVNLKDLDRLTQRASGRDPQPVEDSANGAGGAHS